MNSWTLIQSFRSTSPPPRYTPPSGSSAMTLLRTIYLSEKHIHALREQDGAFPQASRRCE